MKGVEVREDNGQGTGQMAMKLWERDVKNERGREKREGQEKREKGWENMCRMIKKNSSKRREENEI